MQQLLKFFVSLFTFCLPFWVQAQYLVVKNIEEDQTSIEARVNPRYDNNSNPCALIKFTIPGVADASFENPFVVDYFYSNYEYNVYVSKGIKRIRVKHPLAYDLVIDFSKYGIQIESSRVYRVNLFLDGVTETLIEQEIDIKISPENALLVIEPIGSSNQEPFYYDEFNGRKELKLPIGNYKYIAMSAGYYKVEGQFSLSRQSKHILSIELVQRPDKVAIPLKAEVSHQTEQAPIEVRAEEENTKYHKFNFCIEPQMLFSSGLTGAGVSFGFDISRINIELGGYYSFSTSEWITWQRPDNSEYGTYSYRPFIGTFKFGYNAYSNQYINMTPQIGLSFLKTKATMHSGENNLVGDGANSLGLSAGCKVYWIFSKHFHFALTPQYIFRIKKSDTHSMLEAASTRMRKWNNTFGIQVGISYKIK